MRSGGSFDWDAAALACLRRLRAEGLTGAQIGARMGLSRSAVLGKISRLGLSGHPLPKPSAKLPAIPLPPRHAPAGDAIGPAIASNGVTRCPAACAAETSAVLSAADRAALRRHAEAIEAQRDAYLASKRRPPSGAKPAA